MSRKAWTIALEDGDHTVVLQQSSLLGRKRLSVDGRPSEEAVGEAHPPSASAGDIPFRIRNHAGFVAFRHKGLAERCHLVLDGRSLDTGQPLAPRRPGPTWAWGFVAICVAIPVFALGGALPVAVGVGGALACSGIARAHSWPTGRRIALCAGVSVLCWGLYAVATAMPQLLGLLI